MQNIQDNTRELFGACMCGNIEVVEEIFSYKKVDINGRCYIGDNPLARAVRSGHLHIVRRILQHPEVDVNAPLMGARGRGGRTPLMIAVIRDLS